MPGGYEPRDYGSIVRDLLTTLTGGTVRETVAVPAEGDVVLSNLHGPVRRISFLEGVLDGPSEVRYRFTDDDYELLPGEGGAADRLRFRPRGRKPKPGSLLVVNFYPVDLRASPVTDTTVGSVVRTLLETVARELALEEQLLGHIYRSAFVETAEGDSLDRVVALVGVRRLPAGVPVTRLRFSRDEAQGGRVTIPSGTVVTDADGHRYATVADLVLEPGEPSRTVLAAGASTATPPAKAGTLTRLETLLAGVSSVTNEDDASAATAPEPDDQLRRRAQGALQGALRGTVDALRFGLLAVPGVADVVVTEQPNGVPGEVAVTVAYADGAPEPRAEVARRLQDLRPAGIRVLGGEAARRPVKVDVALTLAGAGVSGTELAPLTAAVQQAVAGVLASVPPGGSVRQAPLVAAALADRRVADARVVLRAADAGSGEAGVTDLTLAAGEVLEVVGAVAVATTAESAPTLAVTVQVDVVLPITLAAGVTAAEATAAIRPAAVSYLSSPGGGSVTVDGLLAAVRDDTRFAALRDQVTVTLETGDRFLQLTDGVGSYPAAPGETRTLRNLSVPVQEGSA